MSYFCQKYKKIGGGGGGAGVTDFVSEIRYLKGYPNFENRSSLLDMAPMSVCLKILQVNL